MTFTVGVFYVKKYCIFFFSVRVKLEKRTAVLHRIISCSTIVSIQLTAVALFADTT